STPSRSGRRGSVLSCFFLAVRCPPRFPLFPYTTLFRSAVADVRRRRGRKCGRRVADRRRRHLSGRTRRAPPDRLPRRRLSSRLRSEEHTSELQSLAYLVCRLLLEQKTIPRHDHTLHQPA